MNKVIYSSALQSLDDAINKWPQLEADLENIVRLRKEAIYGPLIRRLYELIPVSAKPIMDHFFFFSYGDKSEANGRHDFAAMFEDRLWSTIGISWINLDLNTMAKFGCPDDVSLEKILTEINLCWENICQIGIMSLGRRNGKVYENIPISICPVNSRKRKFF